jgi:hypothetical protein
MAGNQPLLTAGGGIVAHDGGRIPRRQASCGGRQRPEDRGPLAHVLARKLPISRLMVSDTVTIEPPAVSQLEVTSIAPLVATAIRRAFRDESLSDLCVPA